VYITVCSRLSIVCWHFHTYYTGCDLYTGVYGISNCSHCYTYVITPYTC